MHCWRACRNVIVLDGLDNATTSAASLALPAANFAESEGTLVSLEGRAQRYFPVFQPREERRPSWVWLLACLKELERPEVHALHHFDDITRACAADIPALAGITAAAPDLHYLNLGVKIPRQPARYSGRTAMRANISVHEPKQREDEETALAFTMEGLNRDPARLAAALGLVTGLELQPVPAQVPDPTPAGRSRAAPPACACYKPAPRLPQRAAKSLLPPQPSDVPRQVPGNWCRATAFSAATNSAPSARDWRSWPAPAFIELAPPTQPALGVAAGDGVEVGDGLATLEVRVNATMTPGCAGYSIGSAGHCQPGSRWPGSGCAGRPTGSGRRN